MSSKLTVCGVCEYRKIIKASVVWCSKCDKGLCEECKDHHVSSKVSRKHSIVPISEYQKLSTNLLELTQICSEHNEKYQIYCKKHDSPCCRRCVAETHDTCGELNTINDVIRNVKSSSSFFEMEHMLAELSENFQIIRKDRQENIRNLKENKIKIENEIQQTRVLINNHLDKLQESLMKELYVAEERENKTISSVISSIQEEEREITEYQTNLHKIKQHASDLLTFLVMKHIQQDIINKETFLESLLKEDSMNNVTLSFEKENLLETLPTALKKIGTIILDTRSSDITLTRRKNKEAQIMVPITHVPTIDDLKLTLIQTVKTNGTFITDCFVLPDGRMIFSSYASGQINVVKLDGSLDFTLQPGSCISHIHYIENSQKLVVTSGKDGSITIIDMRNGKTAYSISVGSDIYGIFHKDGKLFYNGYASGLCVFSLEDGSLTKLVNTNLSQFSGIAIWSDQIYYINNDESVVCCDLQGKLNWKIGLAAFIQVVSGITVDNYGRVYVTAYYSNSVVVISPDGNKHRVVLSEKDSLQRPQALFFDHKTNKLLIANKSNEAFLYDVSI